MHTHIDNQHRRRHIIFYHSNTDTLAHLESQTLEFGYCKPINVSDATKRPLEKPKKKISILIESACGLPVRTWLWKVDLCVTRATPDDHCQWNEMEANYYTQFHRHRRWQRWRQLRRAMITHRFTVYHGAIWFQLQMCLCGSVYILGKSVNHRTIVRVCVWTTFIQ